MFLVEFSITKSYFISMIAQQLLIYWLIWTNINIILFCMIFYYSLKTLILNEIEVRLREKDLSEGNLGVK